MNRLRTWLTCFVTLGVAAAINAAIFHGAQILSHPAAAPVTQSPQPSAELVPPTNSAPSKTFSVTAQVGTNVSDPIALTYSTNIGYFTWSNSPTAGASNAVQLVRNFSGHSSTNLWQVGASNIFYLPPPPPTVVTVFYMISTDLVAWTNPVTIFQATNPPGQMFWKLFSTATPLTNAP